MTTERAALTDTAPAGVGADPDLNPSDRPETDQPDAKSADPTAAVSMRHNRNASVMRSRSEPLGAAPDSTLVQRALTPAPCLLFAARRISTRMISGTALRFL